MRVSALAALAVVLALCFAPASQAAVVWVVPMSGDQEAPGPGDPDGFGTAIFTIDDSVSPPTITWEMTAFNIDFPLTGAHIHIAPAGEPGPVLVNFNASLTGGPLAHAELTNILANPTNYYVNLHNAAYPAGAIRGQLPEPGALSLLALAALGLIRRRA